MAETPTMDRPNASRKHTSDTEVRDPDAVQESLVSVWDWVEDNPSVVIGLIVVAIGAGVIYAGSTWWSRHREGKAQEAYYAVEAKYSKIKGDFDMAKMAAAAPAATKDKAPPKAATGDLAKDYGTVVTELETVARDNAGTAAGAQASILAADTYIQYKDFDKAADIAKLSAEKLGDKNLLGQLSRMSWGTAVASKGDCASAVKVWQPILDQKSANYLAADASLKSGLCYESMNDATKAKEMYQRVTTESPDSTSSQTAKALLRAIELKTSTPAAAPAKS